MARDTILEKMGPQGDPAVDRLLLDLRARVAPDKRDHEQALAYVDQVLDVVKQFRGLLAKDAKRYKGHAAAAKRETAEQAAVKKTRYGQRRSAIAELK